MCTLLRPHSPVTASVNHAISACGKAQPSQHEEALRLVEDMSWRWQPSENHTHGAAPAPVVPDAGSITSALAACERAGDWEASFRLIQQTHELTSNAGADADTDNSCSILLHDLPAPVRKRAERVWREVSGCGVTSRCHHCLQLSRRTTFSTLSTIRAHTFASRLPPPPRSRSVASAPSAKPCALLTWPRRSAQPCSRHEPSSTSR